MIKYQNIVVTGGAGFIGSHFVKYMLAKYPHTKIINVDLLTYCGNLENIKDELNHSRHIFYKADIGDFNAILKILQKHKVDCIVNLAAESDNNKAVSTPIDFVKTNALGTNVLLEAARQYGKLKRFHHISTCEVFGHLLLGSKSKFSEQSSYKPRTPYNASKASGDLIAKSYYHTFNLPLTISYACNNYGTHQFPEKIIPVFAIKALRHESLPIFKSFSNQREWIHVSDHCSAIDTILHNGVVGESYNIGTGLEKTIMEIADHVLYTLKKPKHLKKIVPDRLSHDTRYLLNANKIRKLGWKPKVEWSHGLAHTLEWYKNNEKWWGPLLSKSHALKTKSRK